MQATQSRKAKQQQSWPRKVQPGREVVTVYRRKTPSGNFAFMVSNYAENGRRRFDSYSAETEALEAAEALAKRIDRRDFLAASLTQDQAIEYADAATALKPFNVSVRAASAAIAEALKVVGNLSNVYAALKFYAARHKPTIKKPVPDVVAELLKVKESRRASARYMDDLTGRLNRFAECCTKNAGDVVTADVQDWLDGLKLAPQSYRNYRTVLHTLFRFAVARNYSHDNPVEGVERLKVRNGDVAVYTPVEMARLIEAARAFPDFLPCLAIGAFAGLRSAEIERLEWSDVNLAERYIVVGASKAKTASRRIVPIHDNLAAWLAPYAGKQGKLWTASSICFYKRQEAVAAATEVEANDEKGIKAQKAIAWKSNGLRHSYASYRLAQTADAGRTAGELGNSAVVVHKHYKELCKPADAEKWFNVKPEPLANVIPPALRQKG